MSADFAMPMPMGPLPVRLAPAILLAASGAVLSAALLFQYLGGLAPCELCLYERWPYDAAILLGLAGIVLADRRASRFLLGVSALIFLGSAVLALYHLAVEQHWIAGPTACTGGTSGAHSAEELRQLLLARQPVSCDQPAWRFIGVSLAGWNVLASLLISLFSAIAFRRLGPPRPEPERDK